MENKNPNDVNNDKKDRRNGLDSPSSENQTKTNMSLLSGITNKDFFDCMRTAYQVYECVEGNNDVPNAQKLDWDDLEKNPVIKLLLENNPYSSDELSMRRGSEGGAAIETGASSNFLSAVLESKDNLNVLKTKKGELRRNSVSTFGRRPSTHKKDSKSDPEESFIESALKSKLSEVLNEGILDSVLPYMVNQTKSTKQTNNVQPVIKKNASSGTESKKSSSNSTEPKDKSSVPSRASRRKSSTNGEKILAKGDGEVEIHVCDEVKGMKKDFKCPQKLLVSKMGYFADVTSGQKLEDMDISVHCDIQIFDWLMRWVKKDSILVADWPQLDPTNVVPILVSASFLQMEPLLHDCLIYCHSNMSDIVKTNTNLACLNDTILTRLGAMYTNSELESIKDRKDKIQSRLFCKMILSLGEPVYETLRGHYASLATLYKCCKCNKLLPGQIADRIPCLASSMILDRWGNLLSSHSRDLSWNLSEYITHLQSYIKSWRKVYWRLWGECHFLKCTICDNFFPVNQMNWCRYHPDVPQFFSLEPVKPTCLPVGSYTCCGERAYRFQILNNSSHGCQFREHVPEQKTDQDIGVYSIYNDFKDIITLEPPVLTFPEKHIKLVAKENPDDNGRLLGKETFWWEGLKLAPLRQPLGLLGKFYSGSSLPKTQVVSKIQAPETTSTINSRIVSTIQPNLSLSAKNDSNSPTASTSNNINTDTNYETPSKSLQPNNPNQKDKKSKIEAKDNSSSESCEAEESETSSNETTHSEDSSPPRSPAHRRGPLRRRLKFLSRRRGGGRQWAATLSARSNQDQQRQYEERAARQMHSLLARRAAASQPNQTHSLGGVYIRLEAEWKEANLPPATVSQRPVRHLYSAKGIRMKAK